MNKFIDSHESERLRRLIANKEAYLERLLSDDGNKSAAQMMQREIIFLKNDILPIILNNTCIVHNEFVKRCIKVFDSALKSKCNGMLIYQPIDENYCNQPIIGIANQRANQGYGTYGAMEIYVDNMDGNECKIKPVNLLIDES